MKERRKSKPGSVFCLSGIVSISKVIPGLTGIVSVSKVMPGLTGIVENPLLPGIRVLPSSKVIMLLEPVSGKSVALLCLGAGTEITGMGV
jgi:hypothetical protein